MLGISLLSIASAWPLRPENFIFIKFFYVRILLNKMNSHILLSITGSFYEKNLLLIFFYRLSKIEIYIQTNYLGRIFWNLFFNSNLLIYLCK